MAKRKMRMGEELYEQLMDKYSGNLGAATIWELRMALHELHVNHRHHKAVEAAYWDRALARWRGGENEPAPAEALLPQECARCEIVRDSTK